MIVSTAGDGGIPQSLESSRLWSLWDMLKFRADNLLQLSGELGRVTTSLKRHNSDDKMSAERRKANKGALKSYVKMLQLLNFRLSIMKMNEILSHFDSELTYGVLIRSLEDLTSRVYDESKLQNFFALMDDEVDFVFPTAPLFGKEVEDKLPTSVEDISEAGKCLGLGRSTAAVFHLMRVMETGVQKFGDKLGLTLTAEKVWQVILDGVNAEIKKLGKTDDAKRYAAISAYLYNVKLAWRNESMHPKATYTVEEAKDIFFAVCSFMKDLVKVL